MHKILLDEPCSDDNSWVVKTTHDNITYDTLTEQFIVDVGDGCWVEVWGLNRFTRAVEIADKCSA